MKTFAISITFLLVSILSFGQDKTGATITVTIDHIKTNEGHVLLGLHTVDTFMKGKGIQNVKSDITEGKMVATFTNVQPGTYAILALHDTNDNQQMDFGANGMPTESYGMSNNPMSFGPPEFSEAKFEVGTEDMEINIRF